MWARFTVLNETPIASAIAGCVIPLSRSNTIWMRSRCAAGIFHRSAVFSSRICFVVHLTIRPPESDSQSESYPAPSRDPKKRQKSLDSNSYGSGITQPPEHILVRLQMWAPAVPFRLNDDRLDDLASIRILDGLHRRPVSQNWDWLIHPMLPVGHHHGGDFFAHFGMFGQLVAFLGGSAAAHAAARPQVGKHFLGRLDFIRTITNARAECHLDLLAYGVGARPRVDLCNKTRTVDLDPAEHGIVPFSMLLIAALLPGETNARQFVLSIACGIRQQVFVGLVQSEMLQRIKRGLWRDIEVEYELLRRKRFAIGVLQDRQLWIEETIGNFVK